jgi:tetratricopeptide (TPR) repeat protein
MRACHRLIISLIVVLTLLYSCVRQQPAFLPPADITDPPVVNRLRVLIDKGPRGKDSVIAHEMPSLKAQVAPLPEGSKAKGLYYYLEGYYYWMADSDQAAIASYRRMLPPGIKDTAVHIELLTLQLLGLQHVAIEQKVNDSTFTQLFAIIEMAEKFHYADIWRVYDLAAEENFRYGEYDKAAAFAKQAVASYPDKGNLYMQAVFLENLSRIAERQQHLEEAIQLEDSALNLAQRAPEPDSLRIGNIYSALGVLVERNGDEAGGHALMEKGMGIRERHGNITFQQYLNYSQMLMEEKKFPGALAYLDKAIKKAMKIQNKEDLSSAYSTMYRIYYDMGDYKSAVTALNSAANMALQNLQEQQLKKVAELQAVSELKIQQNKTLSLSRQYSSQGTILRQQRIILVILLVVLVLGIILTVVLIRQRKLRTEKQAAELEQRLLRSQMEPHFIFNTMSVLQSFIRHDAKDKAIKYLSRFARLLRLNLESSRQNLVQLHLEVEALENYLALQSIRFDNVFDYTINNIENCEEQDILIPPMLLQPFAENAIQHGMRNLPYKGRIIITLQLSKGMLHCTIEDNGLGLRRQEPAEQEKTSLSGIITQERLKILSQQTGKLASLIIADKEEKDGTGVKVTLMIPVQREGTKG